MKIIAYSWFRSGTSIYESTNWNAKKVGRQFEQFLPLLVRAHQAVWNDWTMRVYHDDRVKELPYWPAFERICDREIVERREVGTCDALCGPNGMLARMRPVFEEGHEAVLCRDIDSIPLPRERRAVEEWMRSGKAIHVIHENAAHSGIMGGTIGIRPDAFMRLTDCGDVWMLIEKFGKQFDYTKQGADQHLLNQLHVQILDIGREILIHELHHDVGDLPGEVRKTISEPMPADLEEKVALLGDSFSTIIGGCSEPLPAFEFYDKLTNPKISMIRDCERSVGIDAFELLKEIYRL